MLFDLSPELLLSVGCCMGRVQFLGGSNSVKEAGAVEEIVGVLVQFLHPGNDGELEQAERAGEVLRPPVLVHPGLVTVQVVQHIPAHHTVIPAPAPVS